MKGAFLLFLLYCPRLIFSQQALPLSAELLIKRNDDPAILNDEKLLANSLFKKGYHTWSKDSIINIMLPEVWKERDSITHIYSNKKKHIQYYYANKISAFSNGIKSRFMRGETWKVLADSALKTIPMPETTLLSYSQSANQFLENYIVNELMEVFLQAREHGEYIIGEKFGLPIDTLKKTAEKHGELFLNILYAKAVLPGKLYERYLANQTLNRAGDLDLITAKTIFSQLKKAFPESRFRDVCKKEIALLEASIARNSGNKNIIFIKNPDSIRFLDSLIAPYKGNVVYLDIWGTWCGPCITEISQHTKPLKDHFKDVTQLVFLYLAMESPQDAEKWREFILLHNVTGAHIYKNDKEIEPFWVDLLNTKDVPRSYPTYAIFDRDGKLVTAQAYRPSNGEALYKQLEEVLAKKEN
ncbi:MAG: TlpA disulfide reductase family protein [Niabella sp.]